MESKIQIGMTIDSGKPIDPAPFLIEASYYRKTAVVQSQQENIFYEDRGDGTSDVPRERLSFDIPPSSALSNQIEYEKTNLNLVSDQANIEGYYITLIDFYSG